MPMADEGRIGLLDNEETSSSKGLQWNHEVISMSDLLKRFELPILVKVVDGTYSMSYSTFSRGEIIMLDSLIPIDLVEAAVIEGKHRNAVKQNEHSDRALVSTSFSSTLAIPKSLTTMSFEVVDGVSRNSKDYRTQAKPPGRRQEVMGRFSFLPSPILPGTSGRRKTRFNSVKSLAKHHPKLVKIVKLSGPITKQSQLKVGQKIHVLGVSDTHFFQDRHLRCRIRDDGETHEAIKLNLKWKGVFDLVPDIQSCFLHDLLGMYYLPVIVRIRDTNPSSKWLNTSIMSKIKQIRTLDLHIRLEREVTTFFVVGVVKGQDGSESIIVMAENVEIYFLVAKSSERKSELYQRKMSSHGRVERELIPPETFLSECGTPITAKIPKWKLSTGTAVLRKKKASHNHANTASMAGRTAVRILSHSHLDFDRESLIPPSTPEPTNHNAATPKKEKLSPVVQDKPCLSPLKVSVPESSPGATSATEESGAGDSTCTKNPASGETGFYISVEEEAVQQDDVPRGGKKDDSMPRYNPPPVPVRTPSRRSSWFKHSSRRFSLFRNPAAERRPLPAPPSLTSCTTDVKITSPSSSHRIHPGKMSSSSSSSPSRSRHRRSRPGTDAHKAVKISTPANAELETGPPLPPRVHSKDILASHRLRRREFIDRHNMDALPLSSPSSFQRRIAVFEGKGRQKDLNRSAQRVSRHHTTLGYTQGEKQRKRYASSARKLSSPLPDSINGTCSADEIFETNLPNHTFHPVSDTAYLVPKEKGKSSKKEKQGSTSGSNESLISATSARVGIPDRTFTSPSEIPTNIRELTCGELAQSLRLLHMRDETVDLFSAHLVNGKLLQKMDKDLLKEEFQLSHFELFKVTQFISGWRP
ncbi:uncharacterized protein [Diadema setosum]|uniref:uncharacterized protein n=1 Tax=Diadema setosum TaxID=31175 RepID=UPI003B3BDD7E